MRNGFAPVNPESRRFCDIFAVSLNVAVKDYRAPGWVAVTRFDLLSFYVRGSNGTLLGPEIDQAQQVGRAIGVKVEFLDKRSSDGVAA